MKRILLVLFAGILSLSFTEDKPAYRIFNSKAISIDYSEMLSSIQEADIILFGESHNDPIVHWLQLELTMDLYDVKGDALVLGAEMFEADNQLLLDEYLVGTIPESKFEDEARLWKNYKTDYKPLVTFALENKLPFIATNVPRRYANLVYRKGFEGLDSLSAEAKQYLPPLPPKYDPELGCYRSMLEMGHMGGGMNMENFPKAQAIKDATMGWFIMQNWEEGKQFLHYNGSGHSDNHEGIVWYLLQETPDLKVMTITLVQQENMEELEGEARADFTILVPSRMTRTY